MFSKWSWQWEQFEPMYDAGYGSARLPNVFAIALRIAGFIERTKSFRMYLSSDRHLRPGTLRRV